MRSDSHAPRRPPHMAARSSGFYSGFESGFWSARMRSDSHSPLPAPAGGSCVPCERSAARAASAGPALGSGSLSPA